MLVAGFLRMCPNQLSLSYVEVTFLKIAASIKILVTEIAFPNEQNFDLSELNQTQNTFDTY
jgi:hypothetical protein